LTFNRTFAKHEQDPLLKDKLKAELPGILNLALSAYARALKEGFTDPPSSLSAKEDWRLEADQVAQFLEDSCKRDEQQSERSNVLFVAYKEWAVTQGVSRTLTHRSFRQRLTTLGFGQGRDKYGKIVTGLRLKSIR
jgi:putative DNA primase/helicase